MMGRDSEREDTQEWPEESRWLVAVLPAAACLLGALAGWSPWLILPLGASALASWLLVARQHRASVATELSEELDCETEYECRELLHQCDRLSQSPTIRQDPDAAFYLSHVQRLRSLAIELAKDRAALKRLVLGLDEPAIRLSTERLRELAAESQDPEVADLYRSAQNLRAHQLQLVRSLNEVRAAGDAHWQHLAAAIGELAASTALRGLRARVQQQEEALQRLRRDAEEYRAVVEELRVSLGFDDADR